MSTLNNRASEVLALFGITKLNTAQEQVLPHILAGHDVCTILKTGGGKSLLYMLPALLGSMFELTVVISPLVALQADQLAVLERVTQATIAQGHLGFRSAVLLNSHLSQAERASALARIAHGPLQLLYIAPEQLKNPETVAALSRANIVRVVVDEAHVLPGYVKGYRPSYGLIGKWIATLPKRPQILTFSATITKKDMAFVQESLGMNTPKVHRFGIRRDNLQVRFKHLGPKKGNLKAPKLHRLRMQAVTAELEDWNGKGRIILYASTIKMVKKTAKWLKADGWDISMYHGKMKRKKRTKSMKHFRSGDCKIMVATSAFGLGVDQPNVRLVIHVAPPVSMDGYLQEIGRAGRDGKKSRCVLFYANGDWAACQQVIGKGDKANSKRLKALQKLVATGKFSWKPVEKYFGVK